MADFTKYKARNVNENFGTTKTSPIVFMGSIDFIVILAEIFEMQSYEVII